MKKKMMKPTAVMVAISMAIQLLAPLRSFALTTGPAAPEVLSFEPVGTTDMVSTFSGDFNYNVPLLDVEGYPINIAYHGGVGMDDEASWVGLGWNINPGVINRGMRGLPDDFDGEEILKYMKMKDEKSFSVGLGANIGAEVFGFDLKNIGLDLSVGGNVGITQSNYKGIGLTFSAGVNVSVKLSESYALNGGLNCGIGNQTGADIGTNFGFTLSGTSKRANDDGGHTKGSIGLGVGTGFNSRSGLKDISLSASGSVSEKNDYTSNVKDKDGKVTPVSYSGTSSFSNSQSTTIPIGTQNFLPKLSSATRQQSFGFSFKIGGELWGGYPSANVSVSKYTMKLENDATRKSYGYLNFENASKNDLMDFARENDGVYNNSMSNLPSATATYDVFSVSGQGTGGMFRPYRNDIGTVHDPYLEPPTQQNVDVNAEVGLGGLFEAGVNVSTFTTRAHSGPDEDETMRFQGDINGSLYEKTYFKSGGELSYNIQQQFPQINSNDPVYCKGTSIYNKDNAVAGDFNGHKYNNNVVIPSSGSNSPLGEFDRSARGTSISYLTALEASKNEIGQSRFRVSYDGINSLVEHPRFDNGSDFAPKSKHISEITQTLPDGRRYIYGLPVVNHATREVMFSVSEGSGVGIDNTSGLITYATGDDTKGNSKSKENFYSSTQTPAYASSYLLTSVLTSDYVDVMGDGPTDDDLGGFVKFNYKKTSDDYRWRTPYTRGVAQYNPGSYSDLEDGKAFYTVGSREQWYLASIESKNYIAIFTTSDTRLDALGSDDQVLPNLAANDPERTLSGGSPGGLTGTSPKEKSHKLDHIKLYNKHEYYTSQINNTTPTPVKTVTFGYDYSLCPGSLNSNAPTQGKLTLKKIFFSYGNSSKSMVSPYQFDYSPQDLSLNAPYKIHEKDRWGNYKATNTTPGAPYNYEFPYTDQATYPLEHDPVIAWNLTDIYLPSGGKIHVKLESDDYAFVQDKRAMKMVMLKGVGSSTNYAPVSYLYEGNLTKCDNNNYIYFERDPFAKERSQGADLKSDYFEGQDVLYYNFSVDITGTGRFEPLKGYAKIKSVGEATAPPGEPNAHRYGYIEIEPYNVGFDMNAISVYGINSARYHLPHLFYENSNTDDVWQAFKGMIAQIPELLNLHVKPFRKFVNKSKAKNLEVAKSWLRIQPAGLTKKGGGVRVKELTLDNNWSTISGSSANSSASYGKVYDYTIKDPKYGIISSGVASYEPMIGGDENPFKKPVPYTSESGRLMPSVEFFQEEPYGEDYFPSASVGYSRVAVKSIHFSEARSAQTEQEYLFYTQQDFPVQVDYSKKDVDKDKSQNSLFSSSRQLKVLQGYSIILNDMHGKPKEINNYVFATNTSPGTDKKKKISGVKYIYQTDNNGRLSSATDALVRTRGYKNTYAIKSIELGKDVDFTVDSRRNYSKSTQFDVDINVNALAAALIPIPIPSLFLSSKQSESDFRTLVSTKVIQQYGILKSTENFDHGAVTTTENVLYDAETGMPLLTRTNNEYNDQTYNLSYPAYLAYEGMSPAYGNVGFVEDDTRLHVDEDQTGYLYVKNLDIYTPGDELLVSDPNNSNNFYKLWVLGYGVDNNTPPEDPAGGHTSNGNITGYGYVTFYTKNTSVSASQPLSVSVTTVNTFSAMISNGSVTTPYTGSGAPACGDAVTYTVAVPIINNTPTTVNFVPTGPAQFGVISSIPSATNAFPVSAGQCIKYELKLEGCPPNVDNNIVFYTEDNGYISVKIKRNGVELGHLDGPATSIPNCNSTNPSTAFVIHGNFNSTQHFEFFRECESGEVPAGEVYLNFPPCRSHSCDVVKIEAGTCNGPTIQSPPVAPGPAPQVAANSVPMTQLAKIVGGLQCALIVKPRYANSSPGAANWPAVNTVMNLNHAQVKIIRSGRRNNLDKPVQQMAMMSNPLTQDKSVDKLFGYYSVLAPGATTPFSYILDVSATTFSDEAMMYDNFGNQAGCTSQSTVGFSDFNPFVLGLRGNYRAKEQFTKIANRNYPQQGHSRSAGYYDLGARLWLFKNAATSTTCANYADVLKQNNTVSADWKRQSSVTKYDNSGNALEEKDAIGNFSSAQYGYNKSFPVAVAHNARQNNILFDGFEESAMLMPYYTRMMHTNRNGISSAIPATDDYSHSILSAVAGFANGGLPYGFYGQQYFKVNSLANGLLSSVEAHTGKYSLKFTSASIVTFTTRPQTSASDHYVQNFNYMAGSKYLFDAWVKPISPTTIAAICSQLKVAGISVVPVTGAIEGWYKVQAQFTTPQTSVSSTFPLAFPSGMFIDDIRILPANANMKSFVYDPMTFKLSAQLDENHYATFYEYDQEGLLVRVKKETDKGILTVSENRRSNSKGNL